MVTDLEDSKTHTVGAVWSGEYIDHGFTKSMSELDKCYTMLQELRFVIVGEALIQKNREGSKHEGQKIRPTIGDFGGNCASNQSPFNNGRIEEWEEEKKEDRFLDMEDDVDISALTIKQYIALIPDDIKPGIVNPKIGDDVEFEINANFMRELREKLFAGIDDEDTYEHVHTVLEILDLFHFPGVTHDAIMLRVFPMTLKGRALR
ncbi:hypothetical protein Tco_1130820 [Tanacetum coccineum]